MINTWIEIKDDNQLEDIIETSKEKHTVIFKHSTSCGISAHAMYKLESNWENIDNKIKFYYLDLLQYRNISNKISEKFNITHQSPQIIILKDEKVISHFSHQVISVNKILKEIA